MKRVIQIPGAPAPIGPYSQAVLVDKTLFISGQIPLNPKSGAMVQTGIADSTRQIMDNICSLLKEAGMSTEHLVKCSIFMTNLDEFVEMNAIYGTYFNSAFPARETVQVGKLPMNASIEISCIAIL